MCLENRNLDRRGQHAEVLVNQSSFVTALDACVTLEHSVKLQVATVQIQVSSSIALS